MDTYDYDFYEFMELMKKTTQNLKQMNEAINAMHWQFGEPEEYLEFINAMNEATTGWMSSHC